MALLVVRGDNGVRLCDIELPERGYRAVGVEYVADDGDAHPLVWVDNFYSKSNGEPDTTYHDATVYVHLGEDDPESVLHFDLEG